MLQTLVEEMNDLTVKEIEQARMVVAKPVPQAAMLQGGGKGDEDEWCESLCRILLLLEGETEET